VNVEEVREKLGVPVLKVDYCVIFRANTIRQIRSLFLKPLRNSPEQKAF